MKYSENKSCTTSLIDQLCNTKNDDIKGIILKHLHDLFNSKLQHPTLETTTEASTSILNYGLPDFSNTTLSIQSAANQLQAQLLNLIELYEPRLTNTEITINSINKTSVDFVISATIISEKEAIEIVFDSNYKPALKEFNLNH